jgi:nucleoside 2-deoxyribosyltransferase
MRVYFSCSLTGGRQDQPACAALVSHLQESGHQVLTAHLVQEDVLDRDGQLSPAAVFSRDTAWLRECQAVVAEVSTPSHGVGMEIAFALQWGKPVLCLLRRGARVSKMIAGHPGLEVATYGTPQEGVAHMAAFLAR